MSLILEALRKSEAERRRGEAPDLHAELAPATVVVARPRVASGPALALVAAFVILAGVLAWAWRPAPHAGSPAASTTPVSPPPMPRSSGTEAAPGAVAGGARRLPRVERLRPPPAEAPAVDATRFDGGPANASTPASARAGAAAGASRDPAPSPAPASATAAAGPAVPASAPAATDTATPAPAKDAAPPIATATPSPAPAATAVAAATAGDADLPKVSELDPDVRRQLPPMKLTLHMWNADPGRRFVILDGVRHVEGDRVGSGRITAIDSDGVVIDLGGRAVRLPLR